MNVIKHIICELTGYRPGTVDVSQGDRGSRAVNCRLLENGAPWMIPEGATARVAYTLPDGTEGLYDALPDGSPAWEIIGNIVTVELADQLMAQAGMALMSILVIGPEGGQLATWPIRVMVSANRAARLTVPEEMPPYGAGFEGRLFYGGPGGVVTPLEVGEGAAIVRQDDGTYALVVYGGGGSGGDIPASPSFDDVNIGGAEGFYITSSGEPEKPRAELFGANGDEQVELGNIARAMHPNSAVPLGQASEMLDAVAETIPRSAYDIGADPAGAGAAAVSAHNVSSTSHNDIRIELRQLAERINTALNSEDVDLDQLAEIVAYIKSNKALIDSITTSKVSVADIVDNLVTNAANKPLSAAQGVALKALIDGKLDASKLPQAVTEALTQAKASGEFDGADGRGITSITRTSGNGAAGTTDTYTITYTDGTKSTYQVRNGKNGADGIGISGTEINENGELVITYSNNETVNLGRVVGESSGGAGTPGKDGGGISKTEINGEGHLVITYTDGKTADLGNVIGAPGADGKDGADGMDGADGKTPVKGEDYFTEADKSEMVSAVISALPKYNGEGVAV